MADQVPTTGAWQTDPTIQAYLARMKARGQANRGSVAAGDSQRQADDLAFSRYIEANRQRLGIPDNYWPDPRTNGQTLYDPNQNVWRDLAIVGGSMAAGGYGLGAALGGGAATAAPQLGNVNATIDALSGAQAAAPTIASTTAAAGAKTLTDKLTDPRSIAALASLGLGGATSLFGGQDGPIDDDVVADEIAKSLALQRSRVEQAQPAYDALVRMAYGMTPTSYRGETAPAGFQQPDTTNPAYQYQAPTFGGRR
jgi:hypothetical protein